MTDKKTLHELATEHGQIAPPVPEGQPYLTGHRIAALVHGWVQFEHHYGPVLLTSEAYREAIEAANSGSIEIVKDALPVKPTDEELKAKHAEARAASSEPEAVKARHEKRLAASAEEKNKDVAPDALTPAEEAKRLRSGLPGTPPREPKHVEGATK
jgi:hypothetical protein